MKELSKEEIYDQILNYVSTKRSSAAVGHIHKELLPKSNYDKITLYLEEMNSLNKNAADIRFGPSNVVILKNGLTDEFLGNGGFTKMAENRKAELKKQKDKEDLELRKTKVDLDLAETMLRDYPNTKKKANISLIIASLIIIFEIVKYIISFTN